MNLEFKPVRAPQPHERVYLDGKHVGTIYRTENSFFYYRPNAGGKGETFSTLQSCRDSLKGA